MNSRPIRSLFTTTLLGVLVSSGLAQSADYKIEYKGVCSGDAIECDHIYGPTTCLDLGGISICDAYFASCETICERSEMENFNSACSCGRESVGCDVYGCKSLITCNGSPDCSTITNSHDCGLTRGCTWTTKNPFSTDSISAPLGEPQLDLPAATLLNDTASTNNTNTDDEVMDEFTVGGDLVSDFTLQKSLRSAGDGSQKSEDAGLIVDETLDQFAEEMIESSAGRWRNWPLLTIGGGALLCYL